MNREQDIERRSHAFRKEYREATPAWYRGELHLGFTLVFTVGVIVWCASQIAGATWQQWGGSCCR